jgi:hypothetical protein
VNFDRAGGRRWLLALATQLGNFVLALTGHIDGNAYMLATGAVVGAYIAGNVAQRKVESGAEPK